MTFHYIAKVCVYFSFHHENIRKTCTQGPKFNKITFTALSSDISILLTKDMIVKNIMTFSTVGTNVLTQAQLSPILLIIAFKSLVQCNGKNRGKKRVNIIMETVLISETPPKYLRDSRVQRPYFKNLSTKPNLLILIHPSKGAGFIFALGEEQKYQSITQACPSILGITE